eukprot:TRINITY_DN7181_c0_g1_i1.p1 TRINITY_DN7181_c0_g1~~TRINITY_DN7181_c0_g1_i1.p1  ORF type:complete len:643 (+),score=139.85 TRINITY_DN7181_c0_g1_i1:36-1964(+)
METALRAAFKNNGVVGLDDNVLMKCANLCRTHGDEPAELVDKWEAFALRNQIEDTPTAARIDDFVRDMALQASKRSTPARTPASKSNTATKLFSNMDLSAFGVSEEVSQQLKDSAQKASEAGKAQRKRHSFASPSITPRRGIKQETPTLSGSMPPPSDGSPTFTPTSQSYQSRTNAGRVEVTFNPGKQPLRPPPVTDKQPLNVAIYPNCIEKPYRFMFEKLMDKAAILDMRIDEMSERMVKKHKLLLSEEEEASKAKMDQGEDEAHGQTALAGVSLPTQEPVVVTGRVCCDGEGKLNAKSVLLEGSLETSNGARVLLNLNEVKQYSLFQGQIIAAEGINSSGDVFTPTTIYQGAPLSKRKTTPAQLLDYYFSGEAAEAQAVDVFVATGPFTLSADLTYGPLWDLIDVIRREKPDVIVLLGPFVDSQSRLVTEGELDVTYEQLYQDVITKVAEVVIEELTHSQLVVVPSMRDVCHDFIFPQAPLQVLEHERVNFFSNPCTFAVQEIVFGICSHDVLLDMTKQETSKGCESDRMTRLANHLIEQRSYYPLSPPLPGMNFDHPHIDQTAMPITPDVLILPSDLKHFVKNVNGTLVMNPGRLTKRNSGGTYGRMIIHAPRRNDIPEGKKGRFANVVDRTASTIVRI